VRHKTAARLAQRGTFQSNKFSRAAGIAYVCYMSKKILFVDDSQDWRLIVTAALKDAGYQMVAVSGAGEALLQSNEPDLDLIILDLDLGGENGLMLMKHLKRNHPHAPILLYTGMQHHDEQAIARMRAQGASYFMRKGGMEELVKKVQEILE
jgi:two-component system NtrC family response regulator